jgi:hypothetical protein
VEQFRIVQKPIILEWEDYGEASQKGVPPLQQVERLIRYQTAGSNQLLYWDWPKAAQPTIRLLAQKWIQITERIPDWHNCNPRSEDCQELLEEATRLISESQALVTRTEELLGATPGWRPN